MTVRSPGPNAAESHAASSLLCPQDPLVDERYAHTMIEHHNSPPSNGPAGSRAPGRTSKRARAGTLLRWGVSLAVCVGAWASCGRTPEPLRAMLAGYTGWAALFVFAPQLPSRNRILAVVVAAICWSSRLFGGPQTWYLCWVMVVLVCGYGNEVWQNRRERLSLGTCVRAAADKL